MTRPFSTRWLTSILAVFGAGVIAFGGAPLPAAAGAASTVQWGQWPNSGPVPGGGYAPSMQYDADAGNTVLFGGRVLGVRKNETWVWQGASWAQQAPTHVPPARYAAAMAYDPVHKTVVLFGGEDALLSELSDAWSWNGTDWTDITPSAPQNRPSAREFSSMAYDSVTHTIVLFGGLTFTPTATPVQDTWTFDGTTWTQVFPTTVPSARYAMTLTTDPATGHAMMFGGTNTANPSVAGDYLNDTWIWNGSDWIQQQPATSPGGRVLPALAVDTIAKQVVMFGGGNETGDLQDLWTWNGTNWLQRSPATEPPARAGAAMTYDPFHHQTVLFGGSNAASPSDTWLLSSVPLPVTAVTATNHANARSTVSWTASASNGGSPITNYHVVSVDYTSLARGWQTCNTTALTCTVVGLTNGDAYRFVVTATNSVGDSAAAQSPAIEPAAPPAAPTKVVASSNLDRKSVVSWVAPANHGAAITKYAVTAAPGGRTCTAAITYCTVLGLTNGVAYRFTVKATNVVGTGPASAPSNIATPRTVPGAPTITKVVTGVGTIAIAWGPAATTGGSVVTGYNVYAGIASGKQSTRPLNATPLHVRSFTWHTARGVTYYLTVRAINARGIGPPSRQAVAKAK